MNWSALVAHAERVWARKWDERRILGRMRVVALVATQPALRLGLGHPRAEGLAMGAALPVAIDGAVALSAQLGSLGEGDSGTVTEREFLAVGRVVAVDASVVEAMVEN